MPMPDVISREVHKFWMGSKPYTCVLCGLATDTSPIPPILVNVPCLPDDERQIKEQELLQRFGKEYLDAP